MRTKWLGIILLAALCAATAGVADNRGVLEKYIAEPSQETFDEVKESAEEMINQDGVDPEGYSLLNDLYDEAVKRGMNPYSAGRKARDNRKDLYTVVDKLFDEYVKAPSRSTFTVLETALLALIEMNPKPPAAHAKLSVLYVKSAPELMDQAEGYEKALEVIEAYQAIPGRTRDLSSLRTLYAAQLKNSRERAGTRRADAEMLKTMEALETEPHMMAARRRQEERIRRGGPRGSILDDAIFVLRADLRKDKTNSEKYAVLSGLYFEQGDHPNAYAMWELACQFGDAEGEVLLDATHRLYEAGENYGRTFSISETEPGPNLGMYFLWLKRAALKSKLPAEF